jgi:hypothetical protein
MIFLLYFDKTTTFQMKNPYSVAITNLFILNLLSCLKHSNLKYTFFLFLNLPTIKNTIILEIQIKLFNIESFTYLHIDESRAVEWYVSVNIFLIVVAGLKIKN